MATWKIQGLYVAQIADHVDVVTHVDWACEGHESTISAKLPLDAPWQLFLPYADLTQERVLSWIWAKLNKAAIESKVDAPELPPLNEALKPVISVSKPLPWGN